MLIEFRIRNFALVDDLTVGFGPGLNVLTGETGAGKSVIVTALSVLLGAPPSGPLVRAGCDSARLDAVFHTGDAHVNRLLLDAGLEPEEDGGLCLSREFTAAKRSTARINNAAAPLSLLKSIAERLVDLHGQYAHQTLLRSGDHSSFLDAAGTQAHAKLLAAAIEKTRALRQARRTLAELRGNAGELEKEAEILRYRIEEIDSLLSSPDEYAEVQSRINTLEHSQELAGAVNAAWEAVSRSGSDTSAMNRAAEALHALSRVKGLDPELDAAAEKLEEADALLDTAARDTASLRRKYVHDPALLEELRDRAFRIKELMKKTGSASPEQLFAYRKKSEERLRGISVDEAGMERLEREEKELASAAADAARKLTTARARLAEDFSKRMKKELKELAMPGAEFTAALRPFEDGEPVDDGMFLTDTGAERVEFLISTNPGEPPRPLALVASGGEISRVMLAFKSLLREADAVPVQVFDEIDTGIGGETAHSIARKLAALARARQVVSVTHLPQIAAAADRHITAAKHKAAGRTVIRAAEVTGDERVRELSRMLGATGAKESESLARRMIKEAGKKE